MIDNSYRRVYHAWHGYSDQSHEGNWQWVNPAGHCKKYKQWNRGEPNGGRRENCGMMYKNNNGNWNDAPCNAKLAYICEFGAAARALCQPKGKYIIKDV